MHGLKSCCTDFQAVLGEQLVKYLKSDHNTTSRAFALLWHFRWLSVRLSIAFPLSAGMKG